MAPSTMHGAMQVGVPLMAFPTTAQLVPEPLGVVLILASWNFPIGALHVVLSSPCFLLCQSVLLLCCAQQQVCGPC